MESRLTKQEQLDQKLQLWAMYKRRVMRAMKAQMKQLGREIARLRREIEAEQGA